MLTVVHNRNKMRCATVWTNLLDLPVSDGISTAFFHGNNSHLLPIAAVTTDRQINCTYFAFGDTVDEGDVFPAGSFGF